MERLGTLLAAEYARPGDVASERLSWVIAGLVALAGVMILVTILFWRATRPDVVGDPSVAMHWSSDGDGRGSGAAQRERPWSAEKVVSAPPMGPSAVGSAGLGNVGHGRVQSPGDGRAVQGEGVVGQAAPDPAGRG